MTPTLRFFRNYGITLVVVSALIWFPVTGFFLTGLTLGLLPSLICNVFLIHLAYAAWTKKFSRAWLAVPIARCPLLEAKQKTSALSEYFGF